MSTSRLLILKLSSAFALKEDIAMVVVGPEDPLVKGIYDYFQNRPELKTHRCYRSLRTGEPNWKEARNLQRLHDASQHPDSPLQKYHFRNY